MGATYIQSGDARLAFVSTNSICQGEQVALLWPNVDSLGIEIAFACEAFKWTNNAKGNAGVICVVVGLRNRSTKSEAAMLIGENGVRKVGGINFYLVPANNLFVYRRTRSISGLPRMVKGNQPTDGGNLILSPTEKDNLVSKYPRSREFIKRYVGSRELIRGVNRWCVWIAENDRDRAEQFPPIRERIQAVRESRLESKTASTRENTTPHRFIQIQHEPADAIIIPKVSSERRRYIPLGFARGDTVISDLAFAVYGAEPWVFSIVSSKLHMIWVRTVGGRMKTDYRYSSALCYNTFPIPTLNDEQRADLSEHVFNVLDTRETYPERTLSDLYDSEKMPESLGEAHHQMDLAVERCCRKKPFSNDEERLEYLFKLYETMIEEEKTASA